MGIVVRQSIKSSIITLVGSLLGVVVTLMSMRFLGKTTYGLSQVLLKDALLFAFVSGFGYNYTLVVIGQRYHASHPLRTSFMRHSLLFPFILTVVICLVLLLVKQPLLEMYAQPEDYELLSKYYILFPIFIFINYLFSWLEGYLLSINKNALQTLLRDVVLRVINIVLIFLYFLKVIDITGFLWAYVFTYFIPLCLLFYIAYRDDGFKFKSKEEQKLKTKDYREIIVFSFYHMLTTVSIVVLFYIDSLLLTPLAKGGIEAVAVFAVASLATNILRSPTRVMGGAVMPTLARTYNDDDLPQLRLLFLRSSVNMQTVSVIFAVLIIVNTHNLTRFLNLIQPGYELVTPLMLILIIGVLADVMFGPNSELISVTKYYKFNFWMSVVFIIVIFALNTLLIKKIGIAGAAWATTAGLIVFNLMKASFLWVKLQINPFNNGTLKLLIASLIIGLVFYFIPYCGYLLIDIFARGIIALVLLVVAVYKLHVSEEITELIRNVIYHRKLF